MEEPLFACIIFLALYLLPGAVFLLISGVRLPFIGRIAVSWVVSFWLTLLPSVILARFGSLRLLPLLVGIGALTVVCATIVRGLRRGTDTVVSRTKPEGLPLALVAIGAVLAFHLREIWLTAAVRGGFFYLSEVKHIADNFGVPYAVRHFGKEIVPQVDKLGFDLQTVPLWLLLGENPLLVNSVGYLGTLVVGCIAVFALFEIISSPLIGAAAVVMVYANLQFGQVTTLRSFFLPEAVAVVHLLIALYLLAFLASGREERKPSHTIFLGLALGACALNHLEVALLAGIFTLFLAFFLDSGQRGGGNGRALFGSAVLAGGVLVLPYLLLGRVPEFVPQLGSAAPSAEQYQAFEGSDPTYEFFSAGERHIPFSTVPQYYPAGLVLREFLRNQGTLFHNYWGALGGLLVLSMAVLSLLAYALRGRLRYPPSTLPVASGLAAVATIVIILALTLVSLRSSAIWLYQTEVLRRIAPYAALMALLIVAAALKIFSLPAPSTAAETRSSRRSVLAGTTVLLVTICCYGLSFPRAEPLPSPYPVSREGVEVLRWLDENLPPGATVLANVVSSGAFHVFADAQGVLEGHQPVLRPGLLHEVLQLMREARNFFAQPGSGHDFLARFGIDTVVVVHGPAGDLGGTLLSPKAPPVDLSPLVADGTLCKATASGHIEVYRRCAL